MGRLSDARFRAFIIEALLLAALGALAFGALVAAQQPGVFAIYNDDGEYLKGAKAIAQGFGYVDLARLGSHELPRYPVGFPLLLAPIAYFWPDVGAYVFGAKVLVGACALGFIVAGYLYLRRVLGASPWLAGGVMALVAGNAAFLEFGAAIMSDVPFSLFSLLSLWAAERVVSADGPRGRLEVLLSALLVVTLLIRYAGLALVAAIALCLLRRHRYGTLARLSAISGLLWLPWLAYQSSCSPSSTYGSEFLDQHMSGSMAEIWRHAAESVYHLCMEGLPSMLLPIAWLKTWLPNLPPAAWMLLGGVVSAGALLTVRAWLRETWRGSAQSPLAPLYVAFTLVLIVVWNSAYTRLGLWQHARLLLPVLPLLLFVSLRDLDGAKGGRRLAVMAALAVLMLGLANQATQVIAYRLGPQMNRWSALDQIVARVDRMAPKDAVVLAWNPPLFTLATRRAAIQFPEQPELLVDRVLRFPVTFLVLTPNVGLDGRDQNRDMILGLERALPGVLHLIVDNATTHHALFRIDRTRLRQIMEEKQRQRRMHAPAS